MSPCCARNSPGTSREKHSNNSATVTIKEELARVVKGEVADDAASISAHAHDASLFSLTPKAVVYPRDAADVERLVAFVGAHPERKLSLTPRCGGTDMTGGAIGESIIVDFQKHLNRLKEIGDGYAVTEPGVFYRDFEKETLKHGLLLPSFPASREICTVGGMAANNSGGEKSLRYGKTENFVESLKAVLSDGREYEFGPLDKAALERKMEQDDFEGRVYRETHHLIESHYDVIKAAKPDVSKNSAGYYLWNVWDRKTFDLTKLLVGSQGTLGLITEIRYRLVHPESHSKLLVIMLKNLDPLPQIINILLKHHPESFESYDEYTMKFAMRYSRDFMKQLGAGAISLALQFLPEVRMILLHGFPKLIMLAEFTGDTEAEVDRKIASAQAAVAPLHLAAWPTRTEREARKYWTIRRESFNLLRKHVHGKTASPFIDDLIVRPEKLPKFLPELYRILDDYHLTLTIVGHVGDGNFHIIPLMDLTRPDVADVIRHLSKRVYDLVFRYGGSMTGEHNDGLVRSPYLEMMYGEKIYKLFEQVKKIFDPRDIFNPGKKVGASMDYALKHLKNK